MAGNPYIPDDDIPTSEATGKAAIAKDPTLGAAPALSTGLSTVPMTATPDSNMAATFTPAVANPYIPVQGPQQPPQLSGEGGQEGDIRKWELDETGIIPEYEALPTIWRAPQTHSLRGATAFSTNSDADDIEKILVKDNPGTVVETVGKPGQKPYKIYRFPGDPQAYAYKPYFRLEDVARAVPGTVAAIGATAAAPAALPAVATAVIANVVQSLLGESAKYAAGADFNKSNVVMAGLTPPAMKLTGAGLKGAGSLVAKGLSKLAAPVGQTADTLVDPLVQKGKDLMVQLGAKPDLSELAQDVAQITQPAVTAAQTAVSQATMDAETAATKAAAKAEADTLAARTVARKAEDKARTKAEDAAMTARNTMQDSVATEAAKAEAAKAAASAPVDSALDGTVQVLRRMGAGETSSLDKKFIDYSMGLLNDLEESAGALYKKIEDGFPKDARIQPNTAFQELQEWLDEKLVGRSPPKLLQKIKADTELEKVGNAVRMPQVVDITRAKQLASEVGHGGISEYAGMNKGEAKYVAELLGKVEDQAARDYGMGELLDKAKAKWTQKQNYRDEIEKVLTLKGEKALREGTLVPALDAAGAAAQKGNLLPLKQIMDAAPPGMKQELMANIVNRVVDPSKGPEHVVNAIKAIAKSPEANELVFRNLPPGARKQLLGLGADMERALAKRETDITAAEAAKKAETTALRRGTAKDLMDVRRTARTETRAARDAEAAALDRAAKEEANTVAAAKAQERAAREAAAQAERLDISLASKLRTAGSSILDGDVRPYQEMLKSAPGRERELAMSTLYHTLVDPTKRGPEALAHMTNGLARLEANPQARKLLLSKVPGAESSIRAVTKLMKEVHSGTAAGGKRAEGLLNALADMGPWAAGRAAGTTAAIGTGLAGGGFATSATAGVGGTIFGRMLASAFGRDSTIETKAANAFLASDVGRGLLKRFKLDKPITQGYINRLVNTRPVQAAARVYGMTPVVFVRKLIQGAAPGAGQILRETGEQTVVPNVTEKEDE